MQQRSSPPSPSPRVPIPFTWLESTFNTRSRTEQLLRPELENGVITQHDFDTAVDFFPGVQRYYSIAGGILGTLSVAVWGQMFRRPAFPIHRIAPLAALASAGGVMGGTVVRANAHADFFRNLDNRTAFFQALDNIQTRLGEKPPDVRTSSAYPGAENASQDLADTPINSRGWEEESPIDRTTVHHSANLPSSAQSSQSKSRWEEIRAEHARSIATRSSWDELRQNTSRPKAESAGGDQPTERLAEQQKFDAMLEAERRKAAEGSQGNSWGSSNLS
ncbi:hypothetical protein BJV78DRAFT_1278129 [Lactifluus subvellereus]|nr:hypothetical protein BJV78DRAFT_1278129 [Lactifluus subvellereus]